ncbi:MAG: Zn-dependent exopeptidase M28 [Planctomycetes bacterium]|nr:Zn-dependent exopeptidase M28 [Planctomycetota bacterium]
MRDRRPAAHRLAYLGPLVVLLAGAWQGREIPRALFPAAIISPASAGVAVAPAFSRASFDRSSYRFDDAAAWRMLTALLACGPRAEESVRARAFAAVCADAAGWGAATLARRPFVARDTLSGNNLIATFPGDGPLAAERIAVIGHFDTVPGAPGALDDGTAVALLAGLAPVFAARPLPRTVVLAAVDLEERGLLGSRAWVAEEAAAGRLADYRVALSTEMLGWKDGIPVLHTFPTGFRQPPETRPAGGGLAPRWLAALTLAAGRDAGRPLHFGDPILFPVYHVIFRHFITPFESDSGAFAERGVPALFLSDCSFARFYPDYHQPSDTLDKVDRARLTAAGRALEVLVLALADRPELPRADSGVAEAEIEYLTCGAWVFPSWALRLAVAAALAPLLLLARVRRGAGELPRGALPLALVLAGATVACAAGAAVASAVVLLPAWLVAPLTLTRRRLARALAVLAVLAPGAAVTAVCLAAMANFRRVVAPTHAGWALALAAVVSVGLALIALLPRPIAENRCVRPPRDEE